VSYNTEGRNRLPKTSRAAHYLSPDNNLVFEHNQLTFTGRGKGIVNVTPGISPRHGESFGISVYELKLPDGWKVEGKAPNLTCGLGCYNATARGVIPNKQVPVKLPDILERMEKVPRT